MRKYEYLPKLLIISVLFLLFLSGCSLVDIGEDGTVSTILSSDETYEKVSGSNALVQDVDSLYEKQEEIPVLYLAVDKGNESDGTDYTWEQVNSSSLSQQGEIPYRCEGLLQIGNEVGPVSGNYGFGELTANSTVRLYGETASTRAQKSYRIDIKDGKGNVDGMHSLILSKYFSDPLRVTEMFCLDFIQKTDGLLSTRAKLVHLYVKDVSQGDATLYEDYGMYTMIEPINKTYLKNRGINTDSTLYKAVDFDFSRREDVLLNTTDASYDAAAFSEVLELRNGTDNSNLLDMLDALNDENTPIEEVIDTYFDSENLYRFLAFEILTGNRDLTTSGYFLLNPTGTSKFYLIAWDQASALRDDYNLLLDPLYSCGWSSGIHIFGENVLVRRLLESETCISDLSEAVDIIYSDVLTKENVAEESEYLRNLAEEMIYSLPDRNLAKVTKEQYNNLLNGLFTQIENNYYAYYDSLEIPTSFSVYDPVQNDDSLTFQWEDSYCIGEKVTYNIVIDDTWDFVTPLIEESGITGTEWSTEKLDKGEYFVKITAVAENGNTQISYEHYPTETKQTIQGVLCFYILDNGSAAASRFDEES